jgi:hypothetical protein
VTTTALIQPSQPPNAEEPWGEGRPARPSPASERPPAVAMLEEILPLIGVVAFAGPPVVLLAGPWLLLALLLIGPFALLLTVVIVGLLAALLVFALAALAATPYLLVRHLRVLRARHVTSRALVRRLPADPAVDAR